MLFFNSRDTEVFKADRNKLFASNEKQINNHTLMLDILHSYMSVVHTYHSRGVLKKYFLDVTVVLCWSLWPKKLLKALNFSFYEHEAPPKKEE